MACLIEAASEHYKNGRFVIILLLSVCFIINHVFRIAYFPFHVSQDNVAYSLTPYRPQLQVINNKCGDTRSKPADSSDLRPLDCKEQIIKSA